MTPTKIQRKMLFSLVLVFTLFSATLSYAIAENGYKNDTNPLPSIGESTLAEGGYKVNIFINPLVTGAYSSENSAFGILKLDLTIIPGGVGNTLKESDFKLDVTPDKSFPEPHDLRITTITTSRTIVGKGYNITITVRTSNLELTIETSQQIINASTQIIKSNIIILVGRVTATTQFKWNTADFAYGYYTISATVSPVPGEAFTGDNTLIYGTIMVTIPGDLDESKDVNGVDFGIFAPAYGSSIGQPAYRAVADIDDSGTIDGVDFGIFAPNYGSGW